MLAKLKSPWERGGFPLKCDRQILELLKSLKTRFDKERKRRSMTDDEERRVAENFSSTTLNLAPRNWLQAINEDKTGMRSDWRQEKIAFLSDYIGADATRTMTMSETQGFVRQSRADFAGEPSTSPLEAEGGEGHQASRKKITTTSSSKEQGTRMKKTLSVMRWRLWRAMTKMKDF